MKNLDIPTYINLFLIIINIGIGIYTFNSEQKTSRINPIINNLLHNLFIPFQNSIGKSLFKKIDIGNVTTIHKNLILLHKEIKDTELEFGLSYLTTYYLDRIIRFGLPLSKKRLQRYNLEFKNFSYYYYKDLNKLRRKAGLPRYKFSYRINFKLYSNKLGVTFYYFKNFILIFIAVSILQLLLSLLTYFLNK
ncbi:hypothetical protein PMT97_11535 [Enterococcus faecalis]|uniref:hypothetical protein n=1 Tax=Enterococcus TaxID=1350 RepID=UPI001A08BCC2|nr:hypothetical protein [Enterococcus faecalis]EGO2682305.1 hypothetical protein [Enterococcus faecalis]EIR3695329.1 hypothetical protein [Enterococcus faecalis]EJI7151784.1 hypothetical protein [Enterococcus faecalis]MDB1624739.1 hypothetical protein [Enterococcus faecalis]